jgi:hypothetical protein
MRVQPVFERIQMNPRVRF